MLKHSHEEMQMYECMLKENLKLNALAWKAKYVGQSYGVFCVSLSEEDKEQIYLEYELLLEKRRQEEDERLQRAKEAQLARSHTKAKKRFSSGK